MNDPNSFRFSSTADEIRRCDWQTRLAGHRGKGRLSHLEVFNAAGQECKAAGDEVGFRVYGLLWTVASFHLNSDLSGNPYGPMWTDPDGSRSAIPDDLDDESLRALREVLDEITDPEYRARVAAVLWETTKDYSAAQIAVHAFLTAAEEHGPGDLWYVECLNRAADLAARLGFGKPLHKSVLGVVQAAINKCEQDLRAGAVCSGLMAIVLAHGNPDPGNAVLCEFLARNFAEEGDWEFARRFWRLAEGWHRKAKNESEEQRCQLAAAECLVSKAEDDQGRKKYGYGYSAHWMGRGVEGLRRARANPARIEGVHRHFLELQRLAVGEMSPMELNVDEVPGFREAEEKVQKMAEAHVQGRDFESAVVRLALITRPTNSADLREAVKRQSEEFVLEKLVSSAVLDHSGKVAEILPPIGFGPIDADAEEEATRTKMVQQAKEIHWPMEVAWRIEPARIAIVREHPVRQRDLHWLVADNPFIPPGHVGIYVRGLQAGFFGDWLSAMHLLIPQIEASLRHVLQQNKVVTSTLESDGTQRERDLNSLLWMPEMEAIFGPEVTFDLRGILIERFGHNMRNESAHGLMPEGAFYQPASVYLWWLALRLCWVGYRQIASSGNK